MPPNRFESEVESFLEGSHGDRTHIKRADHHTVTPLCGTLLPDHRIACEIDDERPYHSLYIGPSTSPCTSQIPKLRTHTPPIAVTMTSTGPDPDYAQQRLMNSREPTSKLMKFVICKRSQPRRQGNCDGLRTFVWMVCTQPLCFAIAWFLVRSKLLANRLIERFGRDKL